MSTAAPVILRPVGNLERISTSRHSLGYYRSVANTARYTIIDPTLREDLPSLIEAAISSVIIQHPDLCCGVINEDKSDTSFVRLDSIDLSLCIEYRTLDASTREEYEQELLEAIRNQHAQFWPELHRRPGWKLMILQPLTPFSPDLEFDLLFAFHHAFADGLSGMAFHRSVLQALNSPSKPSFLNNRILILEPGSKKLQPALEKQIKFKVSWPFVLKTFWTDARPAWLFPNRATPWTGELCSYLPTQSYHTGLKLIELPADAVSKVLATCREQNATLTGLLHGLIVVSLASRVPNATSFVSATPYSLRHLTGLSPTTGVGVHVSSLTIRFPASTLAAIRSSEIPSQPTKEIWTIAREFRKSMAAEKTRLPNDNILGMLPYVSNMHTLFVSKLQKPRSDTYEISNVGSIESGGVGAATATATASEGNWRITRTVFTQSGSVTGPAISFNVASVKGGVLAISITWLQGVVADELIDGIATDLASALREMGTGAH